ncbi:MAG TPA: MIP/aquaporin family protein [Thermoleophilia bacterium]|nr:MIP/aquaporin family protein [Thermoleophilia bacterium]
MPQPTLAKRCIAELIGTFVLVFLGTGSVLAVVIFLGGVDPGGLFLIGFAFGVAVLAMIYTFGHISGTHINPAVSISLWATGRLPAKDMVAYIVAQLIGAFGASVVLIIILGTRAVDAGMGGTAPGTDISYIQAIVSEAVATFFLVLVIWGVAVDKRAPAGWAGLAIGLIVAADIWVTGPWTGASMNPARSFGPILALTFWGGEYSWGDFLIYIIGPVVGGVLAAVVYDFVSDVKKLD